MGLLDKIYEAAVVPELWPAVLDGICGAVQGWGAALHAVDADQQTRFVATDAYAPLVTSWLARVDRPENIRPARFLARRYHGFLQDIDLCTEEELARDAIYNEYFRPMGIGWTVGTILPLPTSDMLIVDLVRRTDLGPFGTSAVRTLDELRPHLARSAYLSARLGMERAKASAAALATVGLPAAVVTRGGRVRAANHMFAELAPRIEIGAFNTIHLAQQAASSLLTTALKEVDAELGAVRSIPLPATPEHAALVLHVLPVRRAAGDLFPGADSILVAMPVTSPSGPMTQILNGLFDLTPAEARLARALTEGDSVPHYATENGLAADTVRGRLKSIFAKTGTHSQSELVGLLAGISLPLGGPAPRSKDSTHRNPD